MSEKKVLNQYPFSKAIGKHDKIRKRFASANVNIVYVTSLVLDVSGRLCPKNLKKIQIFWYQNIARNMLHKMQKYRQITVCRAHAVHMQRSFENLKLMSTKKRCDCECE